MDNSTSSFFKSALTHGIIFGVIMIIISLAMWMFNFIPLGIGKSILMGLIMILIYFFATYWFTKNYRDSSLGGNIKYGRAFLYGLTVMVVASIIGALYSYIFNKFIDPGYSSRVIEASINWTEQYMSSKGVPESTISSAIEKMREKGNVTAGVAAFKAIKNGIIIGAICSLISSAIVKKEENPLKEN